MKVAILCASDRSSAGLQEDESTSVLQNLTEKEGWEVIETALLPDNEEKIRRWLIHACDELNADLILTTGGTGLNPKDVTPEATQSVIQRPVPGIPEAMRSLTLAFTPYAMLSRAVAGVRASSLIINLPGSPKAVKECFEAVRGCLLHAVEAIHGRESHSGVRSGAASARQADENK
jgi:molybdenum cofactor synthesis domain-containing protein